MRNQSSLQETMDRIGFPEMACLWRRFLTLRQPLERIDDTRLERARQAHMGGLLAHPVLLTGCSLAVTAGMFVHSRTLFFGDPAPLDAPVRLVLSLLTVYLFWFALSLVQRWNWKTLCALDLASMLRHDSYRAWFEATPAARAIQAELAALGIRGWDDPAYRVVYGAEGRPAAETVRQALRDVLGHKQERVFQPGRFFEHLAEKKKSIARFVKAHQAELERSRETGLTAAEGAALLLALESEMLPDSAGQRYLQDMRSSLDSLPRNAVEASVWQRDPWVDLTRAQDFYSSASLRGDSWKDALERRTKGLLGPFGYLRNPAISALDLRTREGRCIRVRIAASRVSGRAALFVDAVEGRFDLKPKLVQQAIEDYARACGFALVVYHAFPLNKVPIRFVRHLSAPLVRVPLEFLGCGQGREYLDAFGSPLEPFEYAVPRGSVMAHVVCLDGPSPDLASPGRLRLALHLLGKKGALHGLLAASLVCLAWIMLRSWPPGLVLAFLPLLTIRRGGR